MRKIVLLIALCAMILMTGYAQEPSKVEIKVNELVKRYENTKGVECLTVGKGSGLGMFKAMFNQQFGKDFMKGVTSITIVNYGDASQEVGLELRKEVDALGSMLEEFKMGEGTNNPESYYIKSFASTSADKTISDFITIMENKDLKMIMYMAGKIKAE